MSEEISKRCSTSAQSSAHFRDEGLEACPCRIVCFDGMDEQVEAIGDVPKAIFPRLCVPKTFSELMT
jgi:hypothetical protein